MLSWNLLIIIEINSSAIDFTIWSTNNQNDSVHKIPPETFKSLWDIINGFLTFVANIYCRKVHDFTSLLQNTYPSTFNKDFQVSSINHHLVHIIGYFLVGTINLHMFFFKTSHNITTTLHFIFLIFFWCCFGYYYKVWTNQILWKCKQSSLYALLILLIINDHSPS